jgi:FkbM family methyltransferase
MSKMIKEVFKLIGISKSPKGAKYSKISYSQCGEDLIIQYIFNLRKIRKPTYLDIGANHPFYLSNTALFYQKGCTGINVEPNPDLIKEFYKHRCKDINLLAGVGASEGDRNFYIMNDTTLSSFSEVEIKKYESTGLYKLAEIKKMQVITINSILEKYANGLFPDLLSLDAEGQDLEILKSIDFDSGSPKVICVEAADYSPTGAGGRRSDLVDYLTGEGYYEYANTNLNAIMVKKDFWFI